MGAETFKTILTETLRQAQDGALDPSEGAVLLRAIADALETVLEAGLLPERLWVRFAVKGALAVLRETADNLEALDTDTPEPPPADTPDGVWTDGA